MKGWHHNSLLGLEYLSAEDINQILDLAKSFKEGVADLSPADNLLRGKRIINLFMEPSTRTRIAFEIATKSLGADVISIMGEASSLTKG